MTQRRTVCQICFSLKVRVRSRSILFDHVYICFRFLRSFLLFELEKAAPSPCIHMDKDLNDEVSLLSICSSNHYLAPMFFFLSPSIICSLAM